MGLNLAMHVMVYAFHAGFQPDSLKKALRFGQRVQLWGGSMLALIALLNRIRGSPCSPQSFVGDLVPPILYMTYYMLFLQELRDAGEI